MRVGRLVNLVMLGGGIALVLGPIADAQLGGDGLRATEPDPTDAAVTRAPARAGGTLLAAVDPGLVSTTRTDVDPITAGWAEFAQQAARPEVAGQAALLASAAAIIPQAGARVPAATLAASVPEPAPAPLYRLAQAEPAAVGGAPATAGRPVAVPTTTPPLAQPATPPAASAPAPRVVAPGLPAPAGSATPAAGSATPAAGTTPPASAAGGGVAVPVTGPVSPSAPDLTRPAQRAGENAPTVGQLPEPDDKALRFFAQQGDMRRMETEIQRLRALYPNWQPPRDLLEPQAQQMEDQLVQRLWDLYGQGRSSEIREAIAQRQVQDPSWRPPADLIAKMDEAEARERIVNASDQQQWRQVLQIAQRNPQLLVCESVDVLWRVAEAFAKTDRDDRAADVYGYILQNCDDAGERVSSMEKARALLPSDRFEGLFQYERRTPEGVGEFNVIRLDMARTAVGRAVGEGSVTVDPQVLDMLEENARKTGSAEDATLVGWYLYSNNDPGQALEWFDFARSHGGDAKAFQGAVLSLQRLERFADAENVGHPARKLSADVMTAYLNAVSSWLASAGPPLVPEQTLQRFADVVVEEKSALGARSLGWYALNTGQVPTAIAWFETSLGWDATEDAAFGLGLGAQRVGDRARFDLVLRTYAPRFPRLPAMFAEAFRPRAPEIETGGQGVITPDGRVFFPLRQQAPQPVRPTSGSTRASPYAGTVASAFPMESGQPEVAQDWVPSVSDWGTTSAGLTPAQVVMTSQTGTLPTQPFGSATGQDLPVQALGYADTIPGFEVPVAAQGVQVAQAAPVTNAPAGYVSVPGFPQPLLPVRKPPAGYVEVANPAAATTAPAAATGYAPAQTYQPVQTYPSVQAYPPAQTYQPVQAYQPAPVRTAPAARPASGRSSGGGGAAACVARTEQGARTGRLSASEAVARGWCLMELNRPMEAATAFEMAASRSHGDKTATDAAYGRSLAYLRLGATQNAAVAAAAAPQSPARQADLSAQILAQRAVAAYNAGRCAEVFVALDERARMVPENRNLMLLRGWCYYKAGNISAANQIFQALDASLSTAESRSGTAEAFDYRNRKLHKY